MSFAQSLRTRLMILILTPLILIACLLGYWRYTAALATSEALFDRSLLAATLAISRDVTVSGGDALSITTRDLIAEAAGGQVFYHVSGPDRAYLTGYAYPPVPPAGLDQRVDIPVYYQSLYRGDRIRALRLLERAEIGRFRGLSSVTVWQRQSGRRNLAQSLALQSAILLGTLLAAVAVITWFGVNRGLRPLLDLESAIAARSSTDLSEIRRTVPREVRGIVSTLNGLFEQVREAMRARDVFISDAAHQLRNPVAGMLALAEAAETASTEEERRRRMAELKASAARTARLTTQMLAFERLKGQVVRRAMEDLDLNALLIEVATRNADRALGAGVAFDFHGVSEPVMINGDRLMLEEAVENLIDNALRHGPPSLSRIEIVLRVEPEAAVLSIIDDGAGLSPKDAPTAFQRFGQIRASDGAGLGLAIVAEITAMHGAGIAIDEVESGASVSLRFPAGPGAPPA